MTEATVMTNGIPEGVIFNAYPDSIGTKLADIVDLLNVPEMKDAFSLFYILPSFFNSDLDRGFSIVDYGIDEDLSSEEDLHELKKLDIKLKFDLVLNHLSVRSAQFQDLLQYGDQSEYHDFFIDWNLFWHNNGDRSPEGCMIPKKDHLDKLFMRKPGFPTLKLRFPDGSQRYYWNTFYQKVTYPEITAGELSLIDGLTSAKAEQLSAMVNRSIQEKVAPERFDFGSLAAFREAVISILERKAQYLGQMDLNAKSEKVWDFFEQTLQTLNGYGANLIRLDAFAYLHKEAGMENFFNRPGTWDYLERLRQIAAKYDLTILPEIHSQYGSGIHLEMAEKGYLIYDFFLPGLLIDALDRGSNKHLLHWIRELVDRGIKTVNMLGCHDGIPVLDLGGSLQCGDTNSVLLSQAQIEAVIENIIGRGGIVKNLFGPDGKKIAYYQVNATYYSALGENDQKMRLARAIQLFTPGTPQVWYLDLFAGKNNYQAIENGDACCHKEINRTNLSLKEVQAGLKRAVVRDQLRMLRLRNTSPAFRGSLEIGATGESELELTWKNGGSMAKLQADLIDYGFRIIHTDESGEEKVISF
jgi:sucrose phosphorylase